MVPFNFQLEIGARQTPLSAEQLDQLADEAGFMRYHIRTFNHRAVIYVNIENESLAPAYLNGFSEEEVFTLDEVKSIATAIRQYNFGHKLAFDQMRFDF